MLIAIYAAHISRALYNNNHTPCYRSTPSNSSETINPTQMIQYPLYTHSTQVYEGATTRTWNEHYIHSGIAQGIVRICTYVPLSAVCVSSEGIRNSYTQSNENHVDQLDFLPREGACQ